MHHPTLFRHNNPMPIFQLNDDLIFPPPAYAEDEGILAVGGDLSQERLLLAYRHGIFPWYSTGEPIIWWSPDPRMVLFPDEFHCSRRLARTLRQDKFEVRMDTAFSEVIVACATVPRRDQDGTWITPDMQAAYRTLHNAGYGHSIEVWQDQQLVGGMYGLSLGGAFFGESMFSRVRDASKVAMAALVDRCKEWGFLMIDCQVANPHLLSLGARDIPREDYLNLLDQSNQRQTRRGSWT